MKSMNRALRVAVAGSMVAGSLAVLVPSSAGAVTTLVAACSGQRGIATAKSTFIWPGDGKAAGVTDKDHDVSISTKGIHAVGTTPTNLGGTNLGTCSFLQNVAWQKGITKTTSTASRQITKWGSKTVTPTIDCVSETTPDADEWPASGKISYTYGGAVDPLTLKAPKTDAYITFTNPAGSATDTVTLTGLVAKGMMVGAQLSAGITYTPVVKDKLVTADFGQTPGPSGGGDYLGKSISKDLNVNYDYAPTGDPAGDAVPTANELSAFQGYRISGTLGLGGCQGTAEPVGAETVNLRDIYIQGGPSPLLGSPIGNTAFFIGTL